MRKTISSLPMALHSLAVISQAPSRRCWHAEDKLSSMSRISVLNTLLYIGVAFAFASCTGATTDNKTQQPASDSFAGCCDTLSAWQPLADSVYISEETSAATEADFVNLTTFCPDILQDIRYFSTFNFVGQRIPGYEQPVAYLTRQAAMQLKAVNEDLMQQGYRLKVHDAYRPKRAVDFFIKWGRDMSDQVMKEYFYPNCPKSELFRRGYLAHKSGHSRGSTVDVSLFDMKTGRDADMGGPYDMLDEISHFAHTEGLTQEQIARRRLLREVMSKHNFRPIACEWWHFTLRNEPYPNTYFDFPIR